METCGAGPSTDASGLRECMKLDFARVAVYNAAKPDLTCTHADLIMCAAHMCRADVYPFCSEDAAWVFHHCASCAIFTIHGGHIETPVMFALTVRLEMLTQRAVRVDFTESGEGVVANFLLNGAQLHDDVPVVKQQPNTRVHSIVLRGTQPMRYDVLLEMMYTLLPLVMPLDRASHVFLCNGAYGLDFLVRVSTKTREDRRLFKDQFAVDAQYKDFLPPNHPCIQAKWYAALAEPKAAARSRLAELVLPDVAVEHLRETLCVDMRTFVLKVFRVLTPAQPSLYIKFQTFNMCFSSGCGVAGLFWLGAHPTRLMRLALRHATVDACKAFMLLQTDRAKPSGKALDVQLLPRDDMGSSACTLLLRFLNKDRFPDGGSVVALRDSLDANVVGVEFTLDETAHSAGHDVIADMFGFLSKAAGTLCGFLTFDADEPLSVDLPRIEICGDKHAASAKHVSGALKQLMKRKP